MKARPRTVETRCQVEALSGPNTGREPPKFNCLRLLCVRDLEEEDRNSLLWCERRVIDASVKLHSKPTAGEKVVKEQPNCIDRN